jgi:hypothetical protein
VIRVRTPSSAVREREEEGGRESEKKGERERGRERGRERERERERKREGLRVRKREGDRDVILKGMTGALAPFSYLVLYSLMIFSLNSKKVS